MAQFGDGKQGSWQPRDLATQHLATHTPIQIPRPEGTTSGGFNPMQHQAPWRFQPPFGGIAAAQQSPLFRPTWAQPQTADWQPAGSNNNNSNPDWDKWGSGDHLARPMPQLGLVMGHAALPAPSPMVAQNKEEPMEQAKVEEFTNSPKEDERQSSDHHTASYDISASQSPSDGETEAREHAEMEGADNQTEEHIDVETTTTNNVEENDKDPDQLMVDESQVSTTTPEQVERKEDEASHLLLNFSQQSFPSDETRREFASDGDKFAATSDKMSEEAEKTKEFAHSDHSAFTNPEQQALPNGSPENTTSFCRPPGLGPALGLPAGNGSALVCPICGFSCYSKFHYNSHMNTHGDHQCSMCDYTSRTEGRLKKHMRESHTVEEQKAVGLEIEARTPTPVSTATVTVVTTTPLRPTDTSTLSTTMASLVDAANAAAAGSSTVGGSSNDEPVSSYSSALSMDNLVSSTSLRDSLAPMRFPSALEQIRAFTEQTTRLPETNVNLATALGTVPTQENPEDINQQNGQPRRNSNGKMKQYKCKQCPHISFSKNDQWDHARTHISPDKQMNCPKCKFVTEYKHHLEYHIRNHFGSKPFQCKKCAYQCVNKSMLNSHMKSHTNVYQFRCRDCSYATKYCHSLKLHLKKYNHRRVPEGMDVADLPSTSTPQESGMSYNFAQFRPSPSPATTLAQSLGLATPIVTSQSLNYASQMLLRQHQMEQMNLIGLNGLAGLQQQFNCAICEYKSSSQEELMRHNLTHIMANSASPIVSLYQSLPQMSGLLPAAIQSLNDAENAHPETHETESGNCGDDEMEASSGSTGSPGGSSKTGSGDEEGRKRKGFKVDQIGERLLAKSPSGSESGSHEDEKDGEQHISPYVSSSDASTIQPQGPGLHAFSQLGGDQNLTIFQQACLAQLNNVLTGKQTESWTFQCVHCRMAFQEQALYQIHMGYHGYENVFKCNRCGYNANDSLSFNLHLLQASHE